MRNLSKYAGIGTTQNHEVIISQLFDFFCESQHLLHCDMENFC